MNNTTLSTADRTTHLKVVAVALVASMAVCLIGVSARITPATESTHLHAVSSSVAGSLQPSNGRVQPASVRGSSRANNQTKGGSNV